MNNNSELTKVMMVEDEADIRTIGMYSLEKIGKFTVKYCSSGMEALTEFKDFQPQILLLDIMMPEMDGLMTLNALNAFPEIKKTLVIFMTAKVQANEVALYKSLGVTAVIPKPFNPKELPELLRKIWSENQGKIYG